MSTPIYIVSSTAAALEVASQLSLDLADLEAWLAHNQFSANAGQSLLLPGQQGRLAAVLVGECAEQPLQQLVGLPGQLPPGEYRLESLAAYSRQVQLNLYLGWYLAAYRFNRYLSNPASVPTLQIADDLQAEVLREANATALVRDLINTPTEDMGPDELQAVTEGVAEQYAASVEVISDEQLEVHFPAIHAVGRASHRAPRLIRLSWGDKAHPQVAIAGKGVCFDTGGLSMKSPSGMRYMKKDMGGAAHALALAQMIMDAELPVRLELYIGAVENAVAANAYRPGDVVNTRKGTTVEIGNTDAEGRVVLSDCLTLACEQQPALLIDFATLTGAARIALGTDLPAMFSNDNNVRDQLHALGDEIEDPNWPMPLYQPYMRYLKSHVADISNNASSPKGGCITAALFLQQFVEAGIPWVHFDTYGWNDGDRPGRPNGGEAMGLRASFAYLQQRFAG